MEKVYLCLLSLVLLMPGPLFAQASPGVSSPQSYGRLRFTPPAGWQAFLKADLLILVPSGFTVNNATVSITIFPPAPRKQQSLSHWLEAFLPSVRSGYQILRTEAPTANRSAKGTPSLTMTELLGDPSGSGKIYQLYCAIPVGASGQLIMYSASNARDFERSARTIHALIESVAVLQTTPPHKNSPRSTSKPLERPALDRISI